MVDGTPREIIGVLPADFQFMDRKVSLMYPMRFNRSEVHLGNFSYQGVARLKPGVTLQQANADVARMLPIAIQKFPAPGGFSVKMFEDARFGPNLRFLKDHLLGDVGSTLWVLMATVGMVTCIGLVLLLGATGLFFGCFGLTAARRHGQPLALPLAGIILNAAGLVLFAVVSIDTVFVLTWFHQVLR